MIWLLCMIKLSGSYNDYKDTISLSDLEHEYVTLNIFGGKSYGLGFFKEGSMIQITGSKEDMIGIRDTLINFLNEEEW